MIVAFAALHELAPPPQSSPVEGEEVGKTPAKEINSKMV
jgi:hypothetical protein